MKERQTNLNQISEAIHYVQQKER